MPGLEKPDTGAVSRTGLVFFQLPINSKGAIGHTKKDSYRRLIIKKTVTKWPENEKMEEVWEAL